MLQKTPESQEAVSPPPPQADIAAVLAGGRRSRWPRRFAVAGVVLLAALAGLWLWFGSGTGGASVTYTTAAVTRGDLTVTVTATGTVEPTNQVAISSELSGTVREVLADYNDTVARGQVLARLDTGKLSAAVAVARATLAAREADVIQAEATVAETGATLARVSDLAAKSVSAQQELDQARAASDRAVANLASARATRDNAQASLSLAETDLAKAEITSPIDGVVLSRDVEPGQIVASSFSAPELFTLAEDLARMELQVDIDEADMGKVATGNTAVFTVEAYPGRTFPAAIAKVRYSPETVEGVVTYKAILTVDNAGLLLRPGMTATADITVETVADALLVPNAALRWSPPVETTSSGSGSGLLGLLMPRPPGGGGQSATVDANGKRLIYVLRDGAPVAVPVEVGSSDGTRTAVTGELTAEDKVIVGSRTAS